MNLLRVIQLLLLLSTLGCQAFPNSLVTSLNSAPAQAIQTTDTDDPLPPTTVVEQDSTEPNYSHVDLPAAKRNDETQITQTDRSNNQYKWLRLVAGDPKRFHLRYASSSFSGSLHRPTVVLGQDSRLSDKSLIDPTGSRWEPLGDYPSSSLFTSDISSEDSQLEFPTELSIGGRAMQDYRNFYSRQSLQFLGAGFLAGAVLAHTQADQELYDWAHGGITKAPSDNWSEFLHGTKDLGDGTYTLPVFAGAWALGQLFDDSPGLETLGDWGERSIRGFVVGAPFVAATQLATGGSRPYEVENASRWRPFNDDNGVSGHAFMGALPFLTAAMMTDDVRWKSAFFLASFATPLSRVSDGAHYPSQIFLGWWAAYAAAQAVSQTDDPNRNFQMLPYFAEEGSGVMFQWDY